MGAVNTLAARLHSRGARGGPPRRPVQLPLGDEAGRRRRAPQLRRGPLPHRPLRPAAARRLRAAVAARQRPLGQSRLHQVAESRLARDVAAAADATLGALHDLWRRGARRPERAARPGPVRCVHQPQLARPAWREVGGTLRLGRRLPAQAWPLPERLAGQAVHRPVQYPRVARVPAHLPGGLRPAARPCGPNVQQQALVRHGALHLSQDGRAARAHHRAALRRAVRATALARDLLQRVARRVDRRAGRCDPLRRRRVLRLV
mmetsp:Transcript_19596/g.57755  ORF Transcript_19596/g.57755 Transcript_19596/m.57755 type:complete len:261 (-) Transcript_19596:299-1081(-)